MSKSDPLPVREGDGWNQPTRGVGPQPKHGLVMTYMGSVVSSAAVLLGLAACQPPTEPCKVLAVTLAPQSLTLNAGESGTVTASVSTSNCSTVPSIAWSSSNNGQVSVAGSGNQVQVNGNQPTPSSVTVTATAGGISSGFQVTVLPFPAIALTPMGVAFSGTQGGANPLSQTVAITNSGGGTLSGLAVSGITYGPGATGWLQTATLSGTTATPSVTLTVQAVITGLAPGTYTAIVGIVAAVASNVPQTLPVSLTVLPPPPAVVITPTALAFTATQGGGNPANQITTITNGGGGTLGGLTVGTITYGPGASGWLQAPALSGSTASPAATLTVQPVTTGLAPGIYAAFIPVSSVVASNSPQTVTVTFTVTPPPPAIVLTPATLTFHATQGGGSPGGQFAVISNGGGGTLSGLTIGTISYGPGATGWLQAPSLSGSTANPSATLSIQPVTAGLAAGSYTATIPIQSAGAVNSPINLTVTLLIAAPAPAIALEPASLNFAVTQGAGAPGSQFVTVTNGGGGILTNLSVGTIQYGPGATGWLQTPTLSSGTANPSATLSIRPSSTALAPGTYSATIAVHSPVASNSPQAVTVTYLVQAPAADPCLFATATPITVGQTINGALSVATSCLLGTGRYANLYRLTLSSTTLVAINLTSSFDNFLSLLDYSSGAIIEEDDDDGPGLNAMISRTLGPGTYLLRASSYDAGVTGPLAISVAQVTAGSPAAITAYAGDAQAGPPDTPVAIPPSAIVRDGNGIPVPGVTVTFATVPGVGGLTGAVAVTNASGIATAGSWTLAAGPNVVSAAVAGLSAPAVFSATGRSSTAGFNIDLRFLTMPTSGQFQAFTSAVARWRTVITGDLPAISIGIEANFCAPNSRSMNETVDDLVIQVTLEPIDGPGMILGSAGLCLIRSVGSLPLLGIMRFDTADLATMESGGTLTDVILHEVGHILGIGSLWTQPDFSFLANPSLPSSPGADTRYTGTNGLAGFDLIGGATYTSGGKVPVENLQGGNGTRDKHWRESVLANELMTGFISQTGNPLSLLTVRSLQDFGYAVSTAAADPFFLALSVRAEGSSPAQGVHLFDDVSRGPIYRIDRSGRISDLQGRTIQFLRAKP